jgi:hypothetical protein
MGEDGAGAEFGRGLVGLALLAFDTDSVCI